MEEGNLGNQEAMEEDEARSEATFRLVLRNFSKIYDPVVSPPTYVRNLPWKILVMQRMSIGKDGQPTESLGFFLQCNRASKSSTWSCYAVADLRLISQKEGVENFTRKIKHLFYHHEDDWGYSHFMAWNEILDSEKGYIKDDTIILEVSVTADAPHGVSRDLKKHTGVKNHDATCDMNSHSQTLTNKRRKLNVEVSELEDRKQFKCTWVNSNLKEEKELVLYPRKNGDVYDLLEEAKEQVLPSENGSFRLRMLETINNKIIDVHREDMSLDSLGNAGTKSLRIEEMPKDELELADDELLIPVAHFQKEVSSTFGVPFLLKIKHKEPFSKVKERIQKKLEVPDREFGRYKFARIIEINGKEQQCIIDHSSYVCLPDFLPHPPSGDTVHPRPWLGLEHVNRAPK